MRVCIFRVGCTYGAVISIVYLNLGILMIEYTLRVCILELIFCYGKRERNGALCVGLCFA
jgi:hypothetical protein